MEGFHKWFVYCRSAVCFHCSERIICMHFQGEIDAREDSFRATAEAGQLLLDREHYASEEVKEKLVVLASEKTSLLSMWEERRILYEQCMDLQLFYRDTEQADTWMAKQEVSALTFLISQGHCCMLQVYFCYLSDVYRLFWRMKILVIHWILLRRLLRNMKILKSH